MCRDGGLVLATTTCIPFQRHKESEETLDLVLPQDKLFLLVVDREDEQAAF
jgi:hypothetical protein